MKVGITDLRRNPGIVNIEGKRLVFPSRKEIIRDISPRAYSIIKQFPFLRVVPKDIPMQNIAGSIFTGKGEVEEVIEPEKKEIEKHDVISDVHKENKEESIKEDPAKVLEGTVKVEEPMLDQDVEGFVNDAQDQKVMEDSSIINPDSNNINYQSMSKRDLRALIESKGGDPQGMSKANMVYWLENK